MSFAENSQSDSARSHELHETNESIEEKSSFSEYTRALVIAILVAMILRVFVVQAFRIPTGSMKDTLLIGDFLLVNKFIYGVRTPDHIPGTDIEIPHTRLPAFRTPKRGDVVIFKYPNDTTVDYIKRCVALPGDTVQVRSNIVYINGEPEGQTSLLEKKYDADENAIVQYFRVTTDRDLNYTIRTRVKNTSRFRNYGPVVVPPDHLFMMGDNRDNSSDSRFWGFMPAENIVGRAMIIYFSFDKPQQKLGWNLVHAVRWQRLFTIIR